MFFHPKHFEGWGGHVLPPWLSITLWMQLEPTSGWVQVSPPPQVWNLRIIRSTGSESVDMVDPPLNDLHICCH